MPWPVYLAFKHLFPTGRKGARASVGATLRLAFFLALGLFLILLAFMWWNGVLARMRLPLRSVEGHSTKDIAMDLFVLWLWITMGVAFVSLIFRSTPFFHAMSIFGITLGVAVLITVQSVMNGFAHEYERVFIETQGHLDVVSGAPISDPQEIVQALKQVPGVVLAEPIMDDAVLVRFQGQSVTPFARSFDVNNPDAAHDPLAASLPAGVFEKLDDQSVIIGAGLAYSLRLNIGDKVDVYTLHMLDDIKREQVPMPRELKVVGLMDTGWSGVDDSYIFLSLRLMRQLYGLNGEAERIEVLLDNDDLGHTLAMQEKLAKVLAPISARRVAAGDEYEKLLVYTWQEINGAQMKILIVEKTVMLYIMMVIVVVAAFCILCSLATTVVRKTREIGVLGALGARPAQVAGVFCLQGMFIGLVGTLIGLAVSFILLHYRQSIVEAFVDQQQLIQFYKFYSFPVQYRAMDFVKIVGFTFVISTLAGLLPAWWAARLKPADCLRSD